MTGLAVVAPSSPLRVAVLGNPNTGKSTLFNALTSLNQRTGNYPGVTVEKRTGRFTHGATAFELTDLPGAYSLAPRSPDEMLTVQVLLGQGPMERPPDLILCVVDASNLRRSLFLASQLLDLQLPMVIALNMTDVAERRGIVIDAAAMSATLGVPVVPVQANRQKGLDQLRSALAAAAAQGGAAPHQPFQQPISDTLDRLQRDCPDDCPLRRFVVTRLLFDVDGFMTRRLRTMVGDELVAALGATREELVARTGQSLPENESASRFEWINRQLPQFVTRRELGRISWSARADRVLTHPVTGLLVALLVLLVLFQAVFRIADPASWAIDGLKGLVASGVETLLPAGALRSLLVDGVVEGVGAVLVFLPQIMLLFLFIGLLEDSGYLARASFLMDRYLSRLGLSGMALIPLLSSFACAIPGIMATRTITSRKERLITILIAPLMSCSARLPVYVLLISAFVPHRALLGGLVGLQGLVMLAMYAVGAVVAVGVAWLLRRWMAGQGGGEFLMELPPYKLPQATTVLRRMLEAGQDFVKGAGTLIVAVTILVWAAASFPRHADDLPGDLRTELQSAAARVAELESGGDGQAGSELEQWRGRLEDLEKEAEAIHLEHSWLARGGKILQPVTAPLGWDWRITSAVVAAFPAREVVVSTLGVIFGLGKEVDEESVSLRQRLVAARHSGTDRPLLTLPVALGLMVFFALCAQCVSTLAVIRRETNSWRWPLVSFGYMTALAWLGAFLTVQIARLFWPGT